jgi:hypothetical protein
MGGMANDEGQGRGSVHVGEWLKMRGGEIEERTREHSRTKCCTNYLSTKKTLLDIHGNIIILNDATQCSNK